MVIREWRGRANRSKADAYPTHFRTIVLPELRTVPGFLGACLSQRELEDGLEYLVLTRWHSIEAIKGFAGGDIAKAIVEPGAVSALSEFDHTVQHYEVIEDASLPR